MGVGSEVAEFSCGDRIVDSGHETVRCTSDEDDDPMVAHVVND